MNRKARLGIGKSKVLIVRIPTEWWDALEGMHRDGAPPPRDLIREGVESVLRKAKRI